MKRKQLSIAAAIALAVVATGSATAQIPVTDVAHISQNVINHVQTIAKWKVQYEQMVERIQQAKRQYEALSGSRNLGRILNDPRLREYMPAEWRAIYDQIAAGGMRGLSGDARAIFEANQVFDLCSLGAKSAYTSCQRQSAVVAQNMANAMNGYSTAMDRVNQIDKLMSAINATTDPKSIAELQARIAAENAMIQAEITKLQLIAMIADAQEKLSKQQAAEAAAAFNTDVNNAFIKGW